MSLAVPKTNDNDTAAATGLMECCTIMQDRHEQAVALEERKRRGQYFTPPAICRFMAGLLRELPAQFKLLDAGAGAGSLSVAVCERALQSRKPIRLEIHLFETDPSLSAPLENAMQNAKAALELAGHRLSYHIRRQDFALDLPRSTRQLTLFDSEGIQHEHNGLASLAVGDFDAAIMNPPYFKLAADSPHAQIMSDAFRGQPNVYSLFMARAAELLRPGGELVSITPRSFCNGLYFRDFRRWLFARMTLKRIHLFESRRDTFDDVLQESVITVAEKTSQPSTRISITASNGNPPRDLKPLSLPASLIIDDPRGEALVRIPTSQEDWEVLNVVERWPARFTDHDLAISTGPVVLFRAKAFLEETPSQNPTDEAPLLHPHNVRAHRIDWPLSKRGKPQAFLVRPESAKHLIFSRNCVLLRRFSAKEDKRRLTAAGFFREDWPFAQLALENHLNYVYRPSGELSVEETHGLAALFNSAFLDRYFRIISGNTQVNATEIRVMKFPELDRIAAIGDRVRRLETIEASAAERIVLEELGLEKEFASMPLAAESAIAP